MEILTLAYILIGLGVFLLLAELFLPTGGLLFMMATASFLVGIGILFMQGETYIAIFTMLGMFMMIPVVSWTMFYVWPHTPLGRQMAVSDFADTTLASMPANLGLESLRGKVGKTVSLLRPSGVVEFDGKRIDCISEGMMVDVGEYVRCVDVKTGRVIVRRIDKPTPQTFENADFG